MVDIKSFSVGSGVLALVTPINATKTTINFINNILLLCLLRYGTEGSDGAWQLSRSSHTGIKVTGQVGFPTINFRFKTGTPWTSIVKR